MEDILMKKYWKYIIAVMTVLLIVVGLTACGKSTAQDLQSNKWYLNQKGQSYKTQFNKKNDYWKPLDECKCQLFSQ